MNAYLVIRWVACIAGAVLAKIAAKILAPLVCWLWATEDRLHLRSPFRWMETLDWDMAGDPPWRDTRSDPLSWWNRTRWIWRNGAQAAALEVFGAQAGEDHHDESSQDGSYRLTVAESAFYWRADREIWSRVLELRAGWKLNYEVHGFHKVMFSIRLREKKS